MFLKDKEISRTKPVADIVKQDYRAASVFNKYEITYCCGGKSPLEMACNARGLETDIVLEELDKATRTVILSPSIDMKSWDCSFLIDYVLHIHHAYLEKEMPGIRTLMDEFVEKHVDRFPYLYGLKQQVNQLIRLLENSMKKEEVEIFPYIRQIIHAHKHSEPYAGLFIRTLRKPVEEALFIGHQKIMSVLLSVRKITETYTAPENACLKHCVLLAKLKELDMDLTQHLYIEESILFPKVIQLENELLDQQLPKNNVAGL